MARNHFTNDLRKALVAQFFNETKRKGTQTLFLALLGAASAYVKNIILDKDKDE
jgi:hypothetical protein